MSTDDCLTCRTPICDHQPLIAAWWIVKSWVAHRFWSQSSPLAVAVVRARWWS